MNEFTEQSPEIRDSAKKSGKPNSDVGFQAKKKKGKICQINESAQVTDEIDTDNEDSPKIKTEATEAPIIRRGYDFDYDFSSSMSTGIFIDKPTSYRCSSSDNNETQIARMDKIKAQGDIPYVPRRNRPATPPRDVLD
jgi:hypothetical protein